MPEIFLLLFDRRASFFTIFEPHTSLRFFLRRFRYLSSISLYSFYWLPVTSRYGFAFGDTPSFFMRICFLLISIHCRFFDIFAGISSS